eukprot:1955730-Alexandrium_andersonii.AAC.1
MTGAQWLLGQRSQRPPWTKLARKQINPGMTAQTPHCARWNGARWLLGECHNVRPGTSPV